MKPCVERFINSATAVSAVFLPHASHLSSKNKAAKQNLPLTSTRREQDVTKSVSARQVGHVWLCRCPFGRANTSGGNCPLIQRRQQDNMAGSPKRRERRCMCSLNRKKERWLYSIEVEIHSVPSIPYFLSVFETPPPTLPRPLSFSPWHSDTYQVAGPISKMLSGWFWNIRTDHSIIPCVRGGDLRRTQLNANVQLLALGKRLISVARDPKQLKMTLTMNKYDNACTALSRCASYPLPETPMKLFLSLIKTACLNQAGLF